MREITGDKKRQPLDVIPMGVREQDVHAHRPIQLLHQLVSQRTNPAAGVEYNQLSLLSRYRDARGIAPVARGMRTERRDRTSCAPESDGICHAETVGNGYATRKDSASRRSAVTAES